MKTILNIRRGDSFKGHSLSFGHYDNPVVGGKSIVYSNNYFNASSTQQYFFNKDITELNINLETIQAKWMNKKHKEISDLYIPSCSFHNAVFSLQENVKIFNGLEIMDFKLNFTFLHDCIIADFIGETNGFNFLSHKENINCIKEMQKIFYRVKSNYKHIPVSELGELPNLVEYEHLSVNSPKWMLPNSLLK
tara:strand:- start:14227 stop:14802 length:576 start_codon:yes stop_codon:yes gene_type:complete